MMSAKKKREVKVEIQRDSLEKDVVELDGETENPGVKVNVSEKIIHTKKRITKEDPSRNERSQEEEDI